MIWFWLALGILLLAAEVYSTAFFALFIALGSFAAAVMAGLGAILLVQVVIGGTVALAGAMLARPLVVRLIERRHGGRLPRGLQGVVGQRALTDDAVGDENHPGHVVLNGERWLAVTDVSAPLLADLPVTVVAVNGTTLVVRPRPDPQPANPQ